MLAMQAMLGPRPSAPSVILIQQRLGSRRLTFPTSSLAMFTRLSGENDSRKPLHDSSWHMRVRRGGRERTVGTDRRLPAASQSFLKVLECLDRSPPLVRLLHHHENLRLVPKS